MAHTLPGWNAPTGLAGAWPRSGWCTDQPFLLFSSSSSIQQLHRQTRIAFRQVQAGSITWLLSSSTRPVRLRLPMLVSGRAGHLTVWVQDVVIEDNVINGQPAGNQAIAVARGAQRDTAYAEPRTSVWQWPGGPTIPTAAEGATAAFLEGTVAPVAAALRSAQQVRRCSAVSTRTCPLASWTWKMLHDWTRCRLSRNEQFP